MTWGTVTFGELDVRPTAVPGTGLWAGRVALGAAAVALVAALAAGSARTRRLAAAVVGAAGVAALAAVGVAALVSDVVLEAGAARAAGRIAATTGLPAPRLAQLLLERADGATVDLGPGAIAALACALLLLVAAVPRPAPRPVDAAVEIAGQSPGRT
jgi:hypothetical protein